MVPGKTIRNKKKNHRDVNVNQLKQFVSRYTPQDYPKHPTLVSEDLKMQLLCAKMFESIDSDKFNLKLLGVNKPVISFQIALRKLGRYMPPSILKDPKVVRYVENKTYSLAPAEDEPQPSYDFHLNGSLYHAGKAHGSYFSETFAILEREADEEEATLSDMDT